VTLADHAADADDDGTAPGARHAVSRHPVGDDVLPRVASGDPGAVRECIDRYGSMVYGMARRFVRDAASADDAVQEVFIALWKAAPKFDRATARESTFVITIARRRLIDRLRREQARPRANSLEVVADPPAATRGADPVEQGDLVARAAEAMQSLSPEQRGVLELAIGSGLSYSEVAERLAMPLGTVKSHARRGLIRLRELLGVSAEA
jgi:RNA polymerase sigma-70 factor (ECF subfamily)